MEQTIARTSSGTLDRRSGTEGPKHDPYHWDEYTWTTNDGTMLVLHRGFIDWLTVNGEYLFEPDVETAANIAFEALVGYDINDLEKWGAKVKAQCPCGSRDVKWVDGYPGERFEMCGKCNRVIDVHCNLEAIQ